VVLSLSLLIMTNVWLGWLSKFHFSKVPGVVPLTCLVVVRTFAFVVVRGALVVVPGALVVALRDRNSNLKYLIALILVTFSCCYFLRRILFDIFVFFISIFVGFCSTHNSSSSECCLL
jgi:hypothetical protein